MIARIPAPTGDVDAPLQALIFDSQYDAYRGVVSSLRVMNGRLVTGTKLQFMQTGAFHPANEIGVRQAGHHARQRTRPGRGRLPHHRPERRQPGPTRAKPSPRPPDRPPIALDGYKEPKPMVFCGLYPVDGDDFENLRESLDKLKLNDASITYAPESSAALGFGFRCGFLGLLHMEIVRERLEREFNLSLIATAPSVEYRVHMTDGDDRGRRQPVRAAAAAGDRVHRGADLHAHGAHARASTRARSWSCASSGVARCPKIEYLSPERMEIVYKVPLAEVVTDFFDALKSRTAGYASMDYELSGLRAAVISCGSTSC